MANLNFKKMAQDALSNSFLQSGRARGQWTELDGSVVTIIGMDRNEGPEVDPDTKQIKTDENGEVIMTMYTTVIVEEKPDRYYGGFSQLDRIVKHFGEQFNDDYEALTNELAASGGLKIKTSMTFKNGKNQRNIVVM